MINGLKAFKQKDYKIAKPYLDSCVYFNQQNDQCGYYRALIAFEEKDYRLAKIIFKGVLGIQPNDATAWNYLGLTYQETKHFDTAEICFKNAVRIQSSESKFYSNWAKNEFLKKNYRRSVELYNTAIFLDESNPNYYFNRAICYEKLNIKDSAKIDLEKTVTINPDDSQAKGKLKLYSNNYLLPIVLCLIIALAGLWLFVRKKKNNPTT
jgi:tetratricopeptide (TPR) repeat protein